MRNIITILIFAKVLIFANIAFSIDFSNFEEQIFPEVTLFDKNDKEVVRFSKMETENDLVKRSFVQSFLESVRSKMYGNRK